MKFLNWLGATVIAVLLLFVVGRFFVLQLTTEPTTSGPPGVILAAPPEVQVEDLGETSRAEAVLRLSDLLGPSGSRSEAGVHFSTTDGQEIYWYTERDEAGEPMLVERRSGPGSTRLETRWKGSVRPRLSWARTHETFDAPQLPAGEQRNLYH